MPKLVMRHQDRHVGVVMGVSAARWLLLPLAFFASQSGLAMAAAPRDARRRRRSFFPPTATVDADRARGCAVSDGGDERPALAARRADGEGDEGGEGEGEGEESADGKGEGESADEVEFIVASHIATMWNVVALNEVTRWAPSRGRCEGDGARRVVRIVSRRVAT